MTVNQIYETVNSLVSEALGTKVMPDPSTGTAIDIQGLISLGDQVLSSSDNTDAFLKTLVTRIGKTIFDYKEYKNKFKHLFIDDYEYGCILQRITMGVLPEAEYDESFALENGKSVDMYKVSKPDVKQYLYTTCTPVKYRITIQEEWLRDAFTSAQAMGSFLSLVHQELLNAIEKGLEDTGRICLASMAARVSNSSTNTSYRVRNLVTEYNTKVNPATKLTAQTAVFDADFMAYAMGEINNTLDLMKEYSSIFNDGTKPTFTTDSDVSIEMLSSFERKLETTVLYAAFHDSYLKPNANYATVGFWQGITNPSAVDVIVEDDTDPDSGKSVAVTNLVAIVHDKMACGINQQIYKMATTPLNADGLYYNVVAHLRNQYFNSMDKNFVIFTLN